VPPCRHSGVRISPTRARPVPFCRQGLRPEPLTSARFLSCASRAAPRAVLLDRLVEQVRVDGRAEDLRVQHESLTFSLAV